MTEAKTGADAMEMCSEMMQAAMGKETAPTCPMATMCKRMMEKRAGLGLLALVPGIVLVLVGVLVLVRPEVLVWLLGGTSILLGVVVLAIATYARRWAAGKSDG